MGIIDLFLIAVGLSADAFAVSVSLGLTMARARRTKALIIGLYFGAFQAGMPVIGYILTTFFSDRFEVYGNLIAFGLLCLIGGKMIVGGLRGNDEKAPEEASVSPIRMIPLALATSIDALAVGVSFALLHVAIIPAVSVIGITTLILSIAGVRVGSAFGSKLQSKANLAGGVILVLIGFRMLLS